MSCTHTPGATQVETAAASTQSEPDDGDDEIAAAVHWLLRDVDQAVADAEDLAARLDTIKSDLQSLQDLVESRSK